MSTEMEELLAEYTPAQRRRYLADWMSAFRKMALPGILKEMPEEFAETLAQFDPQTLLKGLTTEQRQEWLRLLSEQNLSEAKVDEPEKN